MIGKFTPRKNFFNQPPVSKGLLEKGVFRFPKVLIVVFCSLALRSKPKKGECVGHTQLRGSPT